MFSWNQALTTIVGAMIGMPLYAYFYDHIGRKGTAIASALPLLISWTVIAFTSHVEGILTAVFLLGIPFGGYIACVAYVVEVADINLRGTLGCATSVGYALGTMLSYAGAYLPYRIAIYLNATVVVVYLVTALFLKESPVYLLQRNDEQAALRSLSSYRGLPQHSKELLEELREMKRMISPESTSKEMKIRTSEGVPGLEYEKLKPEEILSPAYVPTWKILWYSKPAKRALALVVTMGVASNSMGLTAILVYSVRLFQRSVPSLGSIECSLSVSLSLLLSAVAGSVISDRVGRKTLMFWSSAFSGVSMALLGTQLQLDWAPSWFGVTAILAFTFFYNVGAGIIPFVMFGEVFTADVRALCSTIVMETCFLNSFVILFVFEPLVRLLTLHGVFYLFSGICFGAVFYVHFYMPETKGRTHREIQAFFCKKR